MWTTLHRLGVVGLLVALPAFLPAVSAQQSVPPYNRDSRPGEPPPVPGYEKNTPAVPRDSDKPAPGGQDSEIQPQLRGPIHEGYAQPNGPPRPGPAVSKKPPEPIREVPPEQKPEGDNVAWIPGYWSWDEDKSDFIWVSGFWRVAPAGRKWVPGYWTKTDSGWQWVSGFWAAANQSEMPYTEQPPPASLDRGPNIPPPDDDYEYTPGCWLYRNNRYMWSPGFWYRPRPGLLYCPPRWCWTPNGYLFSPGYWDYDLEDRGVLFAPVSFASPLWEQDDWSYTPDYALNTAAVLASLWVRPNWGNYAFGDYYAGRYARLGYEPWLGWGPRFHDPLYGYYRWANRNNLSWRRNLVGLYNGRVRGNLALPPRTLAAQGRLAARGRAIPAALNMAGPLNRFRSDRFRMTTLSATQRSAMTRFAQSTRAASVQRRTLETSRGRDSRRLSALPLNRVPALPGANRPTVRPVPRPGRPVRPGSLPPILRNSRRTPTGPRVNPDLRNSRTGPPRVTRPPTTPQLRGPDALRRTTPTPRSSPSARSVPRAAPRVNPTAPRVQRYSPPARSAPRVAPRYSPPARSAPRFSPPARSAPRFSAPARSAPRFSAPRPRMTAPRPSGGRRR
jgi:hypothetical protein